MERMLSNKKEDKLYFSRDGFVYRYDMKTNQVKKIYASFSEKASYAYRAYNEQGIRLLKVDDKDNLYFCAYGYFARGSYEAMWRLYFRSTRRTERSKRWYICRLIRRISS